MKTPSKLLPVQTNPPHQTDLRLDPFTRLKAQFCAATLTGCLASKEEAVHPTYDNEYLVEPAYSLGDLMFENHVEENLLAVTIFNKKVGLGSTRSKAQT
jgi:hypothetical protein